MSDGSHASQRSAEESNDAEQKTSLALTESEGQTVAADAAAAQLHDMQTTGAPDDSSAASVSQPTRGKYGIRNAMGRVAQMINEQSKAYFLLRFGVDTTNYAMKYTPRSLVKVGSEVIEAIDESIENGLQKLNATLSRFSISLNNQAQEAGNETISTTDMTAGLNPQPAAYSSTGDSTPTENAEETYEVEDETHFWTRLKAKFTESRWFGKVNEILMSNQMIVAMVQRMSETIRPAELFYNTMTEEFILHKDSLSDFIAALMQRMGAAWDERLDPLARVYFVTAWAVSRVVGLGHVVSGAIHLCRTTVNSVIDELLLTWDETLGITERLVDTYFPDYDTPALQHANPSDQSLVQDQCQVQYNARGHPAGTVQSVPYFSSYTSDGISRIQSSSTNRMQYAADDNDVDIGNSSYSAAGEDGEDYIDDLMDGLREAFLDDEDEEEDDWDSYELDEELDKAIDAIEGGKPGSGGEAPLEHNEVSSVGRADSSLTFADSLRPHSTVVSEQNTTEGGTGRAESFASAASIQLEAANIIRRQTQGLRRSMAAAGTAAVPSSPATGLRSAMSFTSLVPPRAASMSRTKMESQALKSTSTILRNHSTVDAVAEYQMPERTATDLTSEGSAVVPQLDGQPRRSLRQLFSKVRHRINQRVAYYNSIGALARPGLDLVGLANRGLEITSVSLSMVSKQIQATLTADWWSTVDQQLLKHSLMQALAHVRRPAEHFYSACVESIRNVISSPMYSTNADEVSASALQHADQESYLQYLRRLLGSAWTDALVAPSLTVFHQFKDSTMSLVSGDESAEEEPPFTQRDLVKTEATK